MNRLDRVAAVLLLALSATAGRAEAQGQPDRFFSDKISDEEAQGEAPTTTLFQGSITSSTFVYSETGGTPLDSEYVQNYSDVSRLYTDVRAQIDAKHVSGGVWDVRVDARARVSPVCNFLSPDQTAKDPAVAAQLYDRDCRSQSGLYGGNEYEARELYARRSGDKSDLYLGRQYVHELAATKIDGVKLAYHMSETWDVIAFGGLYPSRGSRSVDTDYPVQRLVGDVDGSRLLPVAAGAGGSYRVRNLYGALGAVGIVPLTGTDMATNARETPRVFVTGSGYWRQSPTFDVYHYLVADVQSADGAALTNASLGIGYQPTDAVRVTAAVNSVDTETLNITAQNYLADPDLYATAVPRNDLEVTRIASQSARLGVSVALARTRFEVATSGQLRRRPEVTLPASNGVDYTIPAAQAAEVMLQLIDRRSIADFRLAATVLGIFGVGDQSYNHSDARVLRLDGTRDFLDGRGQFEANVSYVGSTDQTLADQCALDPLTCYGTSEVTTLTAGAGLFYRVARNWMLLGNASVGRQTFTNQKAGTAYAQPANLLLTGFMRLSYRF